MNGWKWLSVLCAFQFVVMVIAVSLFYYQLELQRMQWLDLLFCVWLSVITFLLGTPLCWLIGVIWDRRRRVKLIDDGTHPVAVESPVGSSGKACEDFRITMGFQRLRLGFKLSMVTVALLIVAAVAYPVSAFVLYAVAIIYVLSIHERASGWKLLGFASTYIVLLVCAIAMMFSFVSLVFLELLGAHKYALLLPLLIWGAYTYVENRSLKKLDKKFILNLRPARLAALFGILVFAVGFCYELVVIPPDLYLYSVPSFQWLVFGFPFLIISSVLLIVRLNPAPEK